MTNKKFTNFISIVAILLAVLIISACVGGTARASTAEQTNAAPDYIEKVLNKDKITEISIQIKQVDWKWLLDNALKKESRSCDITVNGKTFYNVGIRPKGSSSLITIAGDDTTDRFSFKLDFGEYMEGQTCFGLRKISLNNMYSDKTYMKEYLSYELFDYMGVASPAYTYTNIKINGKEWGLYLAVECIEESFLERQFYSREGNLYKPESIDMGGAGGGMPNFFSQPNNGQSAKADIQKNSQADAKGMSETSNSQNTKDSQAQKDNMSDKEKQPENNSPQDSMDFIKSMLNGKGTDLKYNGDSPSKYSSIREGAIFKTTTDGDFKKVIKMIKNLNSGTNLTKYVNIDQILRYFAVNTFLVNLDSYAGGMYHNYYLYEKDGVFQILPWDLNMSFAGFSMTEGSKAINFPIDTPVLGNLEDFPLIGKLLEVPEYKELYHKYLKEIVEKYINSGVYKSSTVRIEKLIDGYVKKDATSFYTYEDYRNAVPIILTFGLDRAASIDAQLKGAQPSTKYGNFFTTVNLSSLGDMNFGGMMNGMMGSQGSPKGDNRGVMPAMGNMPSQENIQKIMGIMNEANVKELSAEQKDQLKKLGVNDNMLNMIKSMANGNGFPAMANMPGMGEVSGRSYIKSLMQIGIVILSVVFLLAGLLFVFNFKRIRIRLLKWISTMLI